MQRGRERGGDQKAVPQASQAAYPDRNTDNPNAAKSFGEVTAAYDLLSDTRTRRPLPAAEIDEEGNPKMRSDRAALAGGGGASAARARVKAGVRRLPGRYRGPKRLVRGSVRRRDRGRRQSGGFGNSPAGKAAAEGRRHAYRLTVPFVEAATLARSESRSRTARRSTSSSQWTEDGTKIALPERAERGGRSGRWVVTVSIQPHPFYRRGVTAIRMDLPVTLKEAVLGAKVESADAGGPVMLTIPKGRRFWKVLR